MESQSEKNKIIIEILNKLDLEIIVSNIETD